MNSRDVDDRHHRNGDEWQPDAADLVEPAAERRPEHEREAGAHHDDARDAAALAAVVEVRDQREADHPGDGVGGALHQPGREQPGQRFRVREQQARRGQREQPGDDRPLRPIRSDIAPIGTDTSSSVTPNDPNSSPIIVGDAPSCWLSAGSTGIAME